MATWFFRAVDRQNRRCAGYALCVHADRRTFVGVTSMWNRATGRVWPGCSATATEPRSQAERRKAATRGALRLEHEIVDIHPLGLACGHPLGPAGREVPTSSRFFASTEITGSPSAWNALTCALVYRNWASRSAMLPAFDGLGVALQAVPGLLEHPTHRHRTHPVPGLGQLTGQIHRRLRGPPQRRLRVPPVSGSTNSSNAATRFGSLTSAA